LNTLSISIKNLRTIKNLNVDLALTKGVYAVTGINGVGKSTFFNAMAKLVYRAALMSYFAKDGINDTEITYTYNNLKNTWVKENGQWRRKNKDGEEIFFSGIYEASMIFGNRFIDADKKKIHAIYKLVDEDLCPASEFVYENLGEILRGDKTYYKNLKRVKSKIHAQKLGFDSTPYLIDIDGDRVHQYKMSTGEFLLIGLLDYIKKRIDYKHNYKHSQTLLLLDEIDLALHPSAQTRLIRFLNDISHNYNLCIYFSTHSIQILSAIRKDNIYFFEKNIGSNDVKVVNPCYPIYASRSIYEPNGFDFLILLEDELAKKIIDGIISKNNLGKSKLIRTIPCGGWEKVIELQKEINISKLAGHSCKTISILDGDIKGAYDSKFLGCPPQQNIKFLPIPSLEKFLRASLYINPNDDLIDEIGNEFYQVQSLASILQSYRERKGSNQDNDGKGLFSVLKRCAVEQGHNEDTFVKTLCLMIASKFDTPKFEETLIRELS
jgi:predicted ATPase